MTPPEQLLVELDALATEHDAMIRGLAIPNATSNVLFVDLIERMAETLDAFLVAAGRDGTPEGGDQIVWRAASAIGLALFVADLVDGMSRGSTTPAARALARWFPPERLAKIRSEAAAVPPGEG